MNIVSVTSPSYTSGGTSQINCLVTFDNGMTYPYTSNAVDCAPYGMALWTALNSGIYGAIAPYIPPS